MGPCSRHADPAEAVVRVKHLTPAGGAMHAATPLPAAVMPQSLSQAALSCAAGPAPQQPSLLTSATPLPCTTRHTPARSQHPLPSPPPSPELSPAAPGARRHLSCQRGAPPVGCRAASTLGPAEQGGAAWGAWLQRLPEWASSTLARQHVSDSDAR
jgi:hypothetical protein